MNNELRNKLCEIIQEAMDRDGVLPKRAWNPNSKTVAWLKDRGFNMGYRTSRYDRWGDWGAWSIAYGTQTPRSGKMEGFVETPIRWRSPSSPSPMDALVFVPEEMVEKILVLGCP